MISDSTITAPITGEITDRLILRKELFAGSINGYKFAVQSSALSPEIIIDYRGCLVAIDLSAMIKESVKAIDAVKAGEVRRG